MIAYLDISLSGLGSVPADLDSQVSTILHVHVADYIHVHVNAAR